MANYQKYTRGSVHNLFAHYDRTLSNNSNKSIEPSRSHSNYNLATHQSLNQNDFLNQRLSEIKVLKRADVNCVCSWVVTLPQDFQGSQKDFFQKSYDFLCAKYGEKNVISAWVHNDETTPHLHFAFVPVVIDKKKNIEKCSAKECVTKFDLQNFHQDLQNYLEKELRQDVHILNGATANGNATVEQLKAKTAREEAEAILNRDRKIFEQEKKQGQENFRQNLKRLEQRELAVEARERAIEGATIDFGEPPRVKSLESAKNYSKRVFEWFGGIKEKLKNFWLKLKRKEKQLDELEKSLGQRAQNISDEVNKRVKSLLPKEIERIKPGINQALEKSFCISKENEKLKSENEILKKYDYRKVSEKVLKKELNGRRNSISY